MKNLFLTILAVVVFALPSESQTTGEQCQYYPNNGDAGAITSGPATFIPAMISHYSDSTNTAWITIFPVENSPAPRSGIKQGIQPSGIPYFIYEEQPLEQITISAGPGIVISGTYPNFTVSLEADINPGSTPGETGSVVKTIIFNSNGEELQYLPLEQPGIYIKVVFFSDGSTLTSKILQ